MKNVKNLIPAGVVTVALTLGLIAAKIEAGVPLNDINNGSISLGSPNKYGITIAASTATNVNAAIDISRSTDAALFLQFMGSGNETSLGCAALFYPSLDGTRTNADLNHPILMTNTFNNLLQVTTSTNLSAGATTEWQGLGAYRFLYCPWITNGSATVSATNVALIVPYKRGIRAGNP